MTRLKIQHITSTARYFSENLGNEISLDMVEIPGDRFLMGAPEGEEGSRNDERPQHLVTVPRFFMGKYPVTQAQWKAVAQFPQMNRELNPEPSNFEGSDRPVEQVSWYEAVEFCDRLSRHSQRLYRLPSEAEWEYACRAGTKTPFHFGKTITTDLANYDGTDGENGSWSGSYGNGPKGIYRKETTSVGSFKTANAFGLYDMHGNVWEWCLDHWHENYEGAPTDGSAWLTDEESAYRLLRGGSWYIIPANCRSAVRYGYYSPDDRSYYFGFRVVFVASSTLLWSESVDGNRSSVL